MWPAPATRFLRSRQLSPRSFLSRVFRVEALYASSATVCVADHVIARAASAGPAPRSAPLAITSTLRTIVSITLSPHFWDPSTRLRRLQRRPRDRSRCASGAGAAMDWGLGRLASWKPRKLPLRRAPTDSCDHVNSAHARCYRVFFVPERSLHRRPPSATPTTW